MWTLALLLACSSPSTPVAPPADKTPADKTAADNTAAAPAEKPVITTPAPSLDLYGLTLGKSVDADIQAWLTAHALTCPGAPSVRRTTYRYDCRGELPVSLLPDRKIAGTLADLLLVRGDNGPLTHVSSERRYSLPADAVTDFTTALASLTTRFGPPARPVPTPDPARMDGPMVHYAASWVYADLELHLSLLKANGPYIAVTETWDTPGAEKTETARTHGGADPHGADPHGADPHGVEAAPPNP